MQPDGDGIRRDAEAKGNVIHGPSIEVAHDEEVVVLLLEGEERVPHIHFRVGKILDSLIARIKSILVQFIEREVAPASFRTSHFIHDEVVCDTIEKRPDVLDEVAALHVLPDAHERLLHDFFRGIVVAQVLCAVPRDGGGVVPVRLRQLQGQCDTVSGDQTVGGGRKGGDGSNSSASIQ